MIRLGLLIAYYYPKVLPALAAWLVRTALWIFIPCNWDFFTPRRTPASPQPGPASPQPGPALPPEIMETIIENSLDLIIVRSKSIRDYRIRRKEYISEIGKLRLCSRYFRMRVDNRMTRIWPRWLSRDPCSRALEPGNAIATTEFGPATRIIIADVYSCCLPPGANLAIYPKLESVSLNCHNALAYDKLTNLFSLISFEQIVTLPSFLTQLELLHSHRPVNDIIDIVTSACPNLVELRIVPCTMFTKPNCWWWRQHWQDEDHDYMRDHVWENVTGYADGLAESLYGLKSLKAFHIGHYMTHIDAVRTHRTQHTRHHPTGFRDSFSPVDRDAFHNDLHLHAVQLQDSGPPIDPDSVALAKRELWEVPCPQCEQQLRAPIEDTERWVVIRLAPRLESIRTVSFPSFLSDRRICPSHWDIQRDIKSAPGKRWVTVDKLQVGHKYPPEAKLRVRTKTPGSGYFSNSHEIIFVNTHGEWRPVLQ